MKKRTKTALPEPRCALPGLMDFIQGTDEDDQGRRAFETAMGMLGYAGSAAEKEDRKEPKVCPVCEDSACETKSIKCGKG